MADADREKCSRASLFARVTPKQKLDLIELQQGIGEIVAMTGDGVNDAPALEKADIGIAMGQRGTQVAREAADMVLKDDAFSSIVKAIEQGRAIFDNIRKFIIYLLSGNMSEIMIVAFAILAGAPLPLLPLQILYLNMIGDVFPALAIALGEGDPLKMKDPPRDPREPILTRGHWIFIVGSGLVIALFVLAAFFLSIRLPGGSGHQSMTVSFVGLAFARLWHVFNMRDNASGLWDNEITRNPYIWGALALCTLLLIGAIYVPGLSTVLKLEHPGAAGWLFIAGASLIPLLILQVLKKMGWEWTKV
jgi:Ca2+-transporting ATPase